MNQEKLQARAVALTLQTQKPADPSNAFVRSTIEAFGGTLFVVTWHSNKENRLIDNYVFWDGEREHFLFNTAELTRFFEMRNPRRSILFESITAGGAPAIIAIAITITICTLAITRPGEPPATILSHALTTILGFYFGSKVASSHSQRHPSASRKVAPVVDTEPDDRPS